MSLDDVRAARVSLAPLASEWLKEVRGLKPLPDQEQFSGTASHILADARAGVDFHAILDGGRPVGLFKIDRDYEDGRHFAEPGAWGLRGVMIGADYQGRGVGSAAFRVLSAYLRTVYPDLNRLWLTVNCRNSHARQTYLRGGWIDDGTLYHGGAAGPQHVLRLELGA